MESEYFPLNKIKLGNKVIVKKIDCKGSIRRRMLDLGLIKDTVIEVLHKSPSGDPTAYYIRGTVIALREEEAQNIKVLFST